MSQEQQPQNGNKVLVALGSNAASDAGDARETVHAALAKLGQLYGDVRVSRFYQTPAFPAGSGPDFVNAACVFDSDQAPAAILETLHAIEAAFGRTRTLRWGQRTLDLDLIACGGAIVPDLPTFDHWKSLPLEAQKTSAPDTLILPHPRLQDRPFVLVPLADVAPDWVHPVLNLTVAAMLAAHSDDARAEIRAL